MLTKPVAVVLLLAAVLIAAFVGGYVYTGIAGTTPDGEEISLGDADPATPAAGSAAAAGTSVPAASRPGASRARNGATGSGSSVAASDANASAPASGPGAGSVAGAPAAGSPAAPRPRISQDLTVPAGQLITLELVTPLSSETAKVEDLAEAVIAENVTVDQLVAVPMGTKVLGSVTIAEKGGKVKEAARVGVRFHTLVLAPGTEVLITIDPLIQEGVAPSGRSKAAIGGSAAIGAGLGWLFGGAEGAVKGGVAGVGGGTAVTMMTKAQPAVVPKGAKARVRLVAPITVRIER